MAEGEGAGIPHPKLCGAITGLEPAQTAHSANSAHHRINKILKTKGEERPQTSSSPPPGTIPFHNIQEPLQRNVGISSPDSLQHPHQQEHIQQRSLRITVRRNKRLIFYRRQVAL